MDGNVQILNICATIESIMKSLIMWNSGIGTYESMVMGQI